MQEKRSQIIKDKLLEQIISVAYGDAGWLTRIIVNRKAKHDGTIKTVLDEYRATAESIHKLKDEELSESIVNSVWERTSKSSAGNFIGSFVYSGFFTKPILSTSTIAVIILITIALLFFKPREEIQYTRAEIELAQKQLQESISIVNEVFRKAEYQLDNNIIPNHVDKHLNKGLNIINDILIGG